MWAKKAIMVFGIAYLAIFPLSALAQTESEPKQDFFENGFVNGGFDLAPEATPSPSLPNAKPSHDGTAQPLAQMKANTGGVIPKMSPRTGRVKSEGIAVQSVGMLVSSQDPEHLKRSIQSLVDLAIKHKFSLAQIQALGSYKLPKDDAFDRLLAATWILDGQFAVIQKLAEVYNQIKSSPAWLINTAEGQYVLEAPSDPDAYFDEDGLFVPHTPTAPKEDLIGNIE